MGKNHSLHKENARKHIDKRLRNQLRLYFIIATVMVGIVLYNWMVGKLSFGFTFLGVTVGLVVGIFTSRMFRISWDHDDQKVISRFDFYGGVVVALYILFEIGREYYFKHFIDAKVALALTFAFLAGMLIGRVLGTKGKIRKILKEQKVFLIVKQ